MARNSSFPSKATGYLEPPIGRPDPDEPLRSNFSGWSAHGKSTVSEIREFYSQPEYAEEGRPISGDQTKRFLAVEKGAGWPTYGDIPDLKPRDALF
jgi:hypothetical protein